MYVLNQFVSVVLPFIKTYIKQILFCLAIKYDVHSLANDKYLVEILFPNIGVKYHFSELCNSGWETPLRIKLTWQKGSGKIESRTLPRTVDKLPPWYSQYNSLKCLLLSVKLSTVLCKLFYSLNWELIFIIMWNKYSIGLYIAYQWR